MNTQVIQQAMTQNPPRMLGFTYTKKDGTVEQYVVEPYELDFNKGIFWGYKINGDPPGIRKFFMNMMTNEVMLEQVFTPRWQLFPTGK